MRDESGCRTIGCSLTQKQKDEAAGNEARIEKESRRHQCWAGDEKLCSSFDKALIALDNLDLGDGTIQFGFGVNGFARLLGIRGDLGAALDFKGNLAVVATGGGGGYVGAGGGFGGYLTVTNAPSVNYLKGINVQIGGQVGNGETVGAEVVIFRGPDREQYRGLSISDKAQIMFPWPGEFHGTVTHSGIWYQRNLPDLVVDIFRP